MAPHDGPTTKSATISAQPSKRSALPFQAWLMFRSQNMKRARPQVLNSTNICTSLPCVESRLRLGRADASGPSVSTLRRSVHLQVKGVISRDPRPKLLTIKVADAQAVYTDTVTRSSRALCPPCITRATYSNHMTINYADTCRLDPLVVRISRSHISRLHHIHAAMLLPTTCNADLISRRSCLRGKAARPCQRGLQHAQDSGSW